MVASPELLSFVSVRTSIVILLMKSRATVFGRGVVLVSTLGIWETRPSPVWLCNTLAIPKIVRAESRVKEENSPFGEQTVLNCLKSILIVVD